MSDSASDRSRPRLIRRLISAPTIVDLAVAMAVIALISAIAIPVFFSQPQVTLDHAAILLANDLRYAQNEAAITGENTRVLFDQAGDGYSVEYRSGVAVANPVGGADLVREYSYDAIFRGVYLEVLDGGEFAEFSRSGFALGSLEVHLHYEGDRRVVRMADSSGLVEIEGLESDWADDGL